MSAVETEIGYAPPWPDYDPEDRSTWTVMPAPYVDPSWTAALTAIGGLTPFGRPMLEWRWGATYVDPMALDGGLKYWIGQTEDTLEGFAFTDPETGTERVVKREADVPISVLIAIPKYDHIDLGQRRIIIENWRSAEFLAASQRYQGTATTDPDTVKEFFFCAACHAPNNAPKEAIKHFQGLPACENCGSKRTYRREARFEGDGTLLREATGEGAYDCFLILENALGDPMPPNGHALGLIAAAWQKYTSQTTRERLNEMLDDVEPQLELQRAATSPTNPFAPPTFHGR